jgi:rubrerythrin
MSFFDDLTQKARDVASTASEKAKEAADSAKLSAAILAERRELDKNYRAVGQWYVSEHGLDAAEAIADVVAACQVSQEKIAQFQASRDSVEAQEAAMEPVGTVCPVCGKISDSKFCPHCGAPMGD